MKHYAQINEDNIVIGLSMLSAEVENEKLVEIENSSEDYMYRKYENGVFSEEKFLPETLQEVSEIDALNDYIVDMDYRLLLIELGI